MSSGSDGVLYGASRSWVRRYAASPAGPATRSTARRAIAYRSARHASGDIALDLARPVLVLLSSLPHLPLSALSPLASPSLLLLLLLSPPSAPGLVSASSAVQAPCP